MELLVLVKGMGQLVHSLTGEEEKNERKTGAEEDSLAASPPVPPGGAQWPSAAAWSASPPPFISHGKAKGRAEPMRNNYSSLLSKAAFLAVVLKLQLFCTDEFSTHRKELLAPNENASGSQKNKNGPATGY